MEEQLTVRLPNDLAGGLRRLAAETHLRRSELVRIAVRQMLEEGRVKATKGRRPPGVHRLIGFLETGDPDLAEQHRERILEALRSGR